MTEQTPTDAPETPESAASWPAPGSPLYVEPLTEEQLAAARERLERGQRESLEASRKIEKAHVSPEAQKIRDIVREDGNVDWIEFVKHCGGILKVVEMVDEYGLPDTDRIIPKVDELFNTYVQAERDRGSIFIRRPSNRPYVPGRGTAAGEARAAEKRFPGDGPESRAEKLLREEAEAAARAPRMRPR